MSLKTAILFLGGGSWIAQEVGMLDLLLGSIPNVPGVGLNIQRDVKFMGGVSTGALMTFAVNTAFSENPLLTWDYFKEDILFPLTTEQIYLPNEEGKLFPFNTEPLNSLLTEIANQVNYQTLRDLPFDSAIITVQKVDMKPCWVNNIPTVADKIPSGDSYVYTTIREHQLDIESVSSLMCSSAIPLLFPNQLLYYKEGDQRNLITDESGQPAYFIDGGITSTAFEGYEEFFETYGEHFDRLYIISPYLSTSEEEVYKAINEVDPKNAEVIMNLYFMKDSYLKAIVKTLKDYNSNNRLADKIYLSMPEVTFYNPLIFDEQEEQYNDTISWGQSNPDKIAIDITNLDD